MSLLVVAVIASLLTVLDLDRTFYVPRSANRKYMLNAWWWGFVALNAVLAVVLHQALMSLGVSFGNDYPSWLQAVAVGVGYPALVRLKLFSIDVQGESVPFGFEYLYNRSKAYFFRRINDLVTEARHDETMRLADDETLDGLVRRVRGYIKEDQLLSQDEKRERLQWMTRLLDDQSQEQQQKKEALASYILSRDIPIEME